MSIKNLLVPILFLMTIAGSVTAVSAQEWVKLGSQKANHKAEHDTIMVMDWKTAFTKIKLTVADAPVHFYRLRIVFGNGTEEVQLPDVIPAGGESRVIELGKSGRFIRQVDFWYESASLGGKKAKVTLYGMPFR